LAQNASVFEESGDGLEACGDKCTRARDDTFDSRQELGQASLSTKRYGIHLLTETHTWRWSFYCQK